jgi:hypothetical protein
MVDQDLRKSAAETFRKANVLFYAFKNTKNRFFLPTTDNKFGGVEVPYVMFDSGCNTLLLPMPEVAVLVNIYSAANYMWSFNFANSVTGSNVLSLRISDVLKQGGEKSIDCVIQGSTIMVEALRFHVSSEDCAGLLACPKVDSKYHSKLQQHASLKIKKRTHALLGQEVIKQCNSMQTRHCIIVLKPGCNSVPDVEWLDGVLNGEGTALTNPWGKTFDDLEDEDHPGEARMTCGQSPHHGGDDYLMTRDSPREEYD